MSAQRPAGSEGTAVSDSGCFTGLVKSLRVNRDGEITELGLFSRSTTATPLVKGCGATMAGLPFLWDLYEDEQPIAEFCYRDGCLTAINLLW